jgi:hypothetical protein
VVAGVEAPLRRLMRDGAGTLGEYKNDIPAYLRAVRAVTVNSKRYLSTVTRGKVSMTHGVEGHEDILGLLVS